MTVFLRANQHFLFKVYYLDNTSGTADTKMSVRTEQLKTTDSANCSRRQIQQLNCKAFSVKVQCHMKFFVKPIKIQIWKLKKWKQVVPSPNHHIRTRYMPANSKHFSFHSTSQSACHSVECCIVMQSLVMSWLPPPRATSPHFSQHLELQGRALLGNGQTFVTLTKALGQWHPVSANTRSSYLCVSFVIS